MSRSRTAAVSYSLLEIDGVRYAVLREAALHAILRQAGRQPNVQKPAAPIEPPPDGPLLAGRLKQRRLSAGLSQAGLARLAGVRVETLNRIERGHTTPDFATIRKLVQAMQKHEIKQSLV